ncbi:MAG: hypothetical protein HY908_26000 [Myxococcales bacterium]|nr:hypothetical protein [Myxococcales bacterium]
MPVYRDKLFRANEVRRILRRASELRDEDLREPEDAARARSLEEVEALGVEMGIAPELVRRAVAEAVPEPARRKVSFLTGGVSKILFERRLQGRFGAADHARVARLVRRVTGDAGNPQALGDALTWTARNPLRPLVVNVEPDEDGVYVRVEEGLQGLRGQLFGGLLGGLGGGGLGLVVPFGLELAGRFVPVLGFLWVLAVYLLARSLYATRSAKRELEAATLFEELCRQLETGAPAGPRVDAVAADVDEARDADEAREVDEVRDEAERPAPPRRRR